MLDHSRQSREAQSTHTLLISALFSTLSATTSGCFFNGDDIMLLVLRFAYM